MILPKGCQKPTRRRKDLDAVRGLKTKKQTAGHLDRVSGGLPKKQGPGRAEGRNLSDLRHFDHFAAFVRAAGRTNDVGRDGRAAVRTGIELRSVPAVGGGTDLLLAAGRFAFWNGHGFGL